LQVNNGLPNCQPECQKAHRVFYFGNANRHPCAVR
jgi:hypothetical protein